MKNILFWFSLGILIISCDKSKQEEIRFVEPPAVQNIPGVELETFVVTKMNSNNYPQDRASYLADPVKIFHVYNKFTKIPEGSHMYEYALWPKGSSYSYKPKFNLSSSNEDGEYVYNFMHAEYSFNVNGTNGQNVWSTIKTWEAVINNGYGDYYFDTYLNGILVNRIEIPIYSMEQIDSLGIHRYWLNGEYFNDFSFGPEISKRETWVQSKLRYLNAGLESIIKPANYKGFNRFFAVQAVPNSKDEFVIVEIKKQEVKEIRRIKTANKEERKFHLSQVGNDVYFYNSSQKFNTKYNLETGASGPASLPAEITIPKKGVFPSGNSGLSILKSCEENGVFLVEKGKRTKLMDLNCDNDLGWAGWNMEGTKVYFDAHGAFEYDVTSGILTQLLYDPAISNVNVFQIENQDFILFSINDRSITIGTNLNGVNGFYWTEEFRYDNFYQKEFSYITDEIDLLNVDFEIQEPSLSVVAYEDMMSFKTEIRSIGQISSIDFNGYDILRMDLENESECKGCEEGGYINDFMVYFLSKNDTIIFLESTIDKNHPLGKEFVQSGALKIRDAGFALNRFDVFKKAKDFKILRNTSVNGLLSPKQITIQDQTFEFHARKYNFGSSFKDNFRMIGESNLGNPVMVLNQEDGSFSMLHSDSSRSIYVYGLSGPIETTENIQLNEYVQYTDRSCNDMPIDLANIVKMEKKDLTQIGTYSGHKIYKLNKEEVLKEQYQNYINKQKEYEEMTNVDIKTYEFFKSSIPYFFWEDDLGRYIQFTKRDYLSPVACEPILYVYPETTMDVEISVDPKVKIIASYPDYSNSWKIKAESSGELVDYKTQIKDHRLFWEGVSDFLPPLNTGYVKHRTEIGNFLDKKLAYLGLNEFEVKEFKEAWMEELLEKEYCFIGFYDQKYIDRYAPVTIEPSPDQFIRILMDYKPIESPIVVEPPLLSKAPERKGYVVVEWGGLKR